MLPHLTRLAGAGVAVSAIDYIGIGEAIFPAPLEGVKRAIRVPKQSEDTYDIGPDAIGVLGSWAGRQVAALSGEHAPRGDGAAPQNLDASVQAVGAIYPGIHVDEMADNPARPMNQRFGVIASDESNAETVAPGPPETDIKAEDPSVMLDHGTVDAILRTEQGERFHDPLDSAVVDITLLRAEGLGHPVENAITTRHVEEGLISFFDRTPRSGPEGDTGIPAEAADGPSASK